MNLETDLFLRYFRVRENHELYILTGSIKDQIKIEEDEWQGFIQNMKDYQKGETKKILEEVRSNDRSIKRELKRIDQNVNTQIKKLDKKISTLIEMTMNNRR